MKHENECRCLTCEIFEIIDRHKNEDEHDPWEVLYYGYYLTDLLQSSTDDETLSTAAAIMTDLLLCRPDEKRTLPIVAKVLTDLAQFDGPAEYSELMAQVLGKMQNFILKRIEVTH